MKDDHITMLEGQTATLTQQVKSLAQSLHKHEQRAKQSADNDEAMKAKEMVIMALRCDVERKIVQLEDSDKELANAQKTVNELKEKLNEAKNASFAKEVGNAYYPVHEVKNKSKVFASVRFVKNRFNEYGLEKYSAKERVVYQLSDVALFLNSAKQNSLLLKHKSKKAIYELETEFAKEILEMYEKYAPES